MLVRIAWPLVLIVCAAASGAGRADEPAAKPAITVLHNLRYRDGPSKQWQLDLTMPTERGGKPRPAIVVIHGGGWLEGDRSSFASKKHGVPGNIEEFAALGFVAVTINYRLSGEAPFPAALEDCRCAVRWLRAHAKEYHIDAGHIGAYGNSAGGHLAMLLGMPGKDVDESSRVQAVVSDSGPIDLLYQHEHNQLRQVVSKFLGGPPEGKRLAAYRQASPRHQIGKDTPPLLLIYGVADEQVPVETADEFVTALHRAGLQDITYHRLAYVGHCPHSLVRISTMQSAVNDFFLRTLMHPETAQQVKRQARAVRVLIQSDKGDIEVRLDAARAPATVANFLRYVDAHHYDGGRFHRTVTPANQPDNPVKIEVIQAGVKPAREKDAFAPIGLERTRDTGMKHKDGTFSMARDGPDTATSDFFICIGDQPELDFGGKRNPDGHGFAAFGTVVKGMDVVRKIQTAPATGQTLAPAVKISRIVRLP